MFKLPNEDNIRFKMEDKIESARTEAALEFLVSIRQLLYKINLSRHVLSISAGMGACNILINGKCVTRHSLQILTDIEDALDWDWCAYLNDRVINKPAPEILQQWFAAKESGIPPNMRMG